ncbi:S-layer homology domain-containing protein [Paenibacillus sp. BR2-3]|uniref:S-layer homology domain-containing protein n=1 Tax=Paenibacillus sp. BR2-3 TaxID=3048494 RepID=UPI0039777D8F
MSVSRKWMVGLLVAGLMVGVIPVVQKVSAETVYTYKDELSTFTVEGSNVQMFGPHVVWRSKAANYAGQIYYGNKDTNTTVAITKHGKLTDTPAVGVNGNGDPIVVWADKRDLSGGASNFNWDIYSYNVKTRTEKKLNVDVGEHVTPSIEGDYVVWQTNPKYEMHLYNLATGIVKDLGLGRNPVIRNGRIVYKGGMDDDLYEYVISSESSHKILDLPYTSYVERFVFNGKEVLWKQRDLDGYGKYTYLDLEVNNPLPIDLTPPVAQSRNEYIEMSISNGSAVWLEATGDKATVRGADLQTGNTYSLGVIKSSQFIGFNGEEFELVNDNRLVSREIVRSEVNAPTTAAPLAEGELIGPNGGVMAGGKSIQLVFEPGTFGKDARIELNKSTTIPTIQTKGMTWLGTAWKWTSDIKLVKPASLTYELEQSLATANRANRTGIYRYNEETGQWIYTGGTFDTSWRTIRTQVQDPGVYGVFVYEPSFTDIKSHWAKTEVEVLASKWIVNGMSMNRYEPGQSVSRAQFAKMLVEAAGFNGQTTGTVSFKDVPAGHWASDAIEYAAAAGWIKGYEGSLFKPNASITREEMMVMLTNAASLRKEEQSEVLTSYSDAGKVHSWSKLSVQAALKSGLVQGNGDQLNLGATCTRAEAAVVIYRWLVKKGVIFNG